MNSPGRDYPDCLCCPGCGSGNLNFAPDRDQWAACTDCSARFVRVEGIPFLVTPDFIDVVRGEASDDFNATAHRELDARAVMRANVAYHNEFAEDYEHDVSTYDMFKPGAPSQQRLAATLEEAANVSGGDLLLDICCGTGNVLGAAAGSFDGRLGIDISVKMMEIARDRGLATLGADATNIPLAEASVNCVTAFSALHHIVDYPGVVREMARVLKPGGTFYSDWDPNSHVTHTGWAVSLAVNTLNALRRAVSKSRIPETALQRAAEFHHHSGRGFDAETVAQVLRREGFREVEVIYHLDPPSFADAACWSPYLVLMAALKAISLIAPRRENICPWVAVRGIK